MNSVRRLGGIAAALALAAAPGIVASQPGARPGAPPGAPSSAGAPPAARAPEAADLAALRAAFRSGAPDELTRAGDRLGARRLGDALAGPDRELRLAAAAAAPSAEDALWLLSPLGDLCRSPDRPLAAAAARAAARIAVRLDLDALLQADVPPDWARARAAEYRAQAADAGRWADVRVACLEVAARLVAALGEQARPGDVPYDLAAGPLPPDAVRLLGARAAGDDDGAVVAAAVQAVCEGLELGDPAAPVLEALGRRGMARARAIAADAEQPDAVRRAAAQCLAADDSPASRAALRALGEPDGAPAREKP